MITFGHSVLKHMHTDTQFFGNLQFETCMAQGYKLLIVTGNCLLIS